MGTLKTKTAQSNHVVIYNFSEILCTSTWCSIYSNLGFGVLVDKMCQWIYCCGMAAHIWWITRVSSLRFSCSGYARILRFNRSNKWSMLIPVPTSYWDWHGYEEEEPSNDVISIPYRSYVFLYGYTWSFRVHENAWARSVLLILAIFNVFFLYNSQSTTNTFLPNSTTTFSCTRSQST